MPAPNRCHLFAKALLIGHELVFCQLRRFLVPQLCHADGYACSHQNHRADDGFQMGVADHEHGDGATHRQSDRIDQCGPECMHLFHSEDSTNRSMMGIKSATKSPFPT